MEQSDQGLHCLPFYLHILAKFFYGKTFLFKFRLIVANILGVLKFRAFTVSNQVMTQRQVHSDPRNIFRAA